MTKGRKVWIMLLILLFLTGLGIFLYPYIHGALTDQRIEQQAVAFLQKEDPVPTELPQVSTNPVWASTATTMPQETWPYQELWDDMIRYNEELLESCQEGLDCSYAYESPSFTLADYGLDDEVFGVLEIPAMELKLPIYLGATARHLNNGLAHLSQTSLPIGGDSTNTVIAGHRGWSGGLFLRHIEVLQPGDEVTLTNLWETLQYRVAEIQIIEPHEVEAIHIQPGRELLTLLTCHPYASGGKQRYLVICERNKEMEE